MTLLARRRYVRRMLVGAGQKINVVSFERRATGFGELEEEQKKLREEEVHSLVFISVKR